MYLNIFIFYFRISTSIASTHFHKAIKSKYYFENFALFCVFIFVYMYKFIYIHTFIRFCRHDPNPAIGANKTYYFVPLYKSLDW